MLQQALQGWRQQESLPQWQQAVQDWRQRGLQDRRPGLGAAGAGSPLHRRLAARAGPGGCVEGWCHREMIGWCHRGESPLAGGPTLGGGVCALVAPPQQQQPTHRARVA